MTPLKIYVAGKMSKHSHYDSFSWRDDFLREINKITKQKFISLDPVKASKDYTNLQMVFGSDTHMISEVDVVVVYASDDISIGGSQEILIAKYFNKPVIAFAPLGGKFNGGTKESAGRILTNYRHPFLFSTSDVVCGTVEEVAEALKNLSAIKPKTIDLIEEAKTSFEKKHLKKRLYDEHIIE